MRFRNILAHSVCFAALALAGGCSGLHLPVLPDAAIPETSTEQSFRDLKARITHQEPVPNALSLAEAVARALKYNLDDRVAARSAMLRHAEIETATAEMLPGMVSQMSRTGRNNDFATGSLDLPTGIETDAISISDDRMRSSADLDLTFNVLDFGLSYVRAVQAGDRVLIEKESRRKVSQQIIEDTRTAFWRAAASDRLRRKLHPLLDRVRQAIAHVRQGAEAGAEAPMTALASERELIQMKQTAEALLAELEIAKAQLATLINAPPNATFWLIANSDRPDPPVLDMTAADMIAEAMFNRPEIRDLAYQDRINDTEQTARVLEAIPHIKLDNLVAFDSNHFLLNNNWVSWGGEAALGLINLAKLPAEEAKVGAAAEILDTKSLATTMAVMTQVYISRKRLDRGEAELETARNYADVQTDLVDNLRGELTAGVIGEQTLIREEMNLVVAEAQADIAAGNLESAQSGLISTLGYDLEGQGLEVTGSIKMVTEHLKHTWSNLTSISPRAKFLFEQAQARERERQRKAAEERARRMEAQRISREAAAKRAEEARVAREEVRQHKAEATLEAHAAAKTRAEEQRVRHAEMQAEEARLRAEARQARLDAHRQSRSPANASAAECLWWWLTLDDANADKHGCDGASDAGPARAAGKGKRRDRHVAAADIALPSRRGSLK